MILWKLIVSEIVQNLHQSQQKCQPSNFHAASTYNMKGNNNIAIWTSGKRKSK